MKKLILLLSLVLLVGLLAACGRNGDDVTDDTTQNEEQTQDGQNVQDDADTTPSDDEAATGFDSINWDEPASFSWWMISVPNDQWATMNDNPAIHYVQYRFNTTLDFQHPVAGTEADALAIMMGTGRYTNVMHLSTYQGNVPQLYYDGIIINIMDWLDYMPNLRHWLETDPEFARIALDDQGRKLTLASVADEYTPPWSGLVYRHDILETMTGGNVQFPSGYDVPTTIEDWEYMLPMFLEFFQAAGFADFAPLILPASPMGIFHFGELMNSFGAYYAAYVRDGVVYAGMLQPAMFDYISTMRDWFERGWIHQDFASRVGDMFFMPNPPLVFGGAAGSFFGMMMHLGDRLSMPDFGMYVDVRAMPSPRAEGITHRDMLSPSPYGGGGIGNAIYAGTEYIGRLLAVLDFFYSDDGGRLRSIGPSADQIPPGSDALARMGMPEGTHWFDENGNIVFHPYMETVGGPIEITAVNAIHVGGYHRLNFTNSMRTEEAFTAHGHWSVHWADSVVHELPSALSFTDEEAAILSTNSARIQDLTDQMIALFITGGAELNEDTWNDFLDQLRGLGAYENRDIQQAAFDRFQARTQ